jgi:hypothetical protein
MKRNFPCEVVMARGEMWINTTFAGFKVQLSLQQWLENKWLDWRGRRKP